MLTREAILNANDRKIVKINVPEWGDDLFVRSLTGTERDQWEETNLIREKDKRRGITNFDMELLHAKSRLISMAICDEAGNRLFTDEDVPALAKKNAGAIAYVYNVASALSKISDEDLEELLKN